LDGRNAHQLHDHREPRAHRGRRSRLPRSARTHVPAFRGRFRRRAFDVGLRLQRPPADLGLNYAREIKIKPALTPWSSSIQSGAWFGSFSSKKGAFPCRDRGCRYIVCESICPLRRVGCPLLRVASRAGGRADRQAAACGRGFARPGRGAQEGAPRLASPRLALCDAFSKRLYEQ